MMNPHLAEFQKSHTGKRYDRQLLNNHQSWPKKKKPMELKDDVAEIAAFDPTKKKKKKKVFIQEPADDNMAETTENCRCEDEEGGGIVLESQLPWEGTDRDYLYEEVLERVFSFLHENNPELAGNRGRTVMRTPQILREGTKKTVFVNFMDLCKDMHRQPEHFMAYLLSEMATSGSLDGQQRLVVRGRFTPKDFEVILRKYNTAYVFCNSCKRKDTILSKENRLFFLRCEKCGSSRSVDPIEAGFVARVGRRVK